MSTMTERELLVAKANEEVEIQRMLADACEDEGDLEGAADCMKLVILLRNLVAALAQQQEAEPVTMNGAIAAGDGTLHGAIDYWQERALKAEAALPQVPESLARQFHEAYERLAPGFGYETREDTKQFDPLSNNGRLMMAVCAEIITAAKDEL